MHFSFPLKHISPLRFERRIEGYEPTELPLLQGDFLYKYSNLLKR